MNEKNCLQTALDHHHNWQMVTCAIALLSNHTLLHSLRHLFICHKIIQPPANALDSTLESIGIVRIHSDRVLTMDLAKCIDHSNLLQDLVETGSLLLGEAGRHGVRARVSQIDRLVADVEIACPNDLLALVLQLLQPRLHCYVPQHPLFQPDQTLACIGHIATYNKAGRELEGDDTAFGYIRDRMGGQTGCDIDGRDLGEDGHPGVALLLFLETPP